MMSNRCHKVFLTCWDQNVITVGGLDESDVETMLLVATTVDLGTATVKLLLLKVIQTQIRDRLLVMHALFGRWNHRLLKKSQSAI